MQPGDTVYYIASGRFIRSAELVKLAGGFATLRWETGSYESGGIRLRATKVYATIDEAKKHVMGTPVIEAVENTNKGQQIGPQRGNRAVDLH